MANFVNFKISLKQETVDRIDQIINYNKFRRKYVNKEFSFTHDEIIKDAIMYYLKKTEQIHSHVVNGKALELKTNKVKNNLKEIMIDLGMSQKQLSELTDIDQANISLILSNKSQPKMDSFLRIWVVLGCPPIEDIFYRDND